MRIVDCGLRIPIRDPQSAIRNLPGWRPRQALRPDAHDGFISHASEDRVRVRKLDRALAREGLDTFLDQVDLQPGSDWDARIRQSLRRSRTFVFCVSKASVAKIEKGGYVEKELRYARALARRRPPHRPYLFPALLAPGSIPPDVAGYHAVKLYQSHGTARLASHLSAALTPGRNR